MNSTLNVLRTAAHPGGNRIPTPPAAVRALWLAAAVAVAAAAGCSSSSYTALWLPHPSSSLVADGDWDDVDAAVEAGAVKMEMVAIRQKTGEPNVAAYKLKNVRGEEGVLVVSVSPVTDGPRSAMKLSMACWFGSEGMVNDPERERKLMDRVAARLSQLSGVEFAPIR